MIDFTPIAVSAVGALMTVLGSVFLFLLQSRMKDQAAATTIGNAVNNALGSVQQAADAGLTSHPLQAKIPGVNAATAAGVQYVLDNAGPEIARFTDITPATIASKIDAKIGLAKVAATAVPVVPLSTIPVPLSAVPVT